MRLLVFFGVLVLVLTSCRFFTTKEAVEYRNIESEFIHVTHRPNENEIRRLDSLRRAEIRAEFQSESVFDVFDLDVAPSFPGGVAAMQHFLENNMRYPALAVDFGIQGTVFVSFIVEENGNLSTIHIFERNHDPVFNREAIRLINAMPEWTPGKRNGEIVRTRFTLPIEFRLSDYCVLIF